MSRIPGQRGRARMAYSPTTTMLREARATVAVSEAGGVDVDQVAGERAGREVIAAAKRREMLEAHHEFQRQSLERPGGVDRRQFLRAAGLSAVATGGLFVAADIGRPVAAKAAGARRIVVVGAGLAGVKAAHRLWINYGLRCKVYEADDRVGGRLHTIRNFFDHGQIAEGHAEFINTDHSRAITLANRLGLTLENSNGGELTTGADTYWINGSEYTAAQALADWKIARPAFVSAEAKARFVQQYDDHTAEGRRLDNMNIGQWFDDPAYPQLQNVGGSSGKFARLIMSDIISEFGLDWEVQSSLNAVYELAFNSTSALEPLSGGTEKWHIQGGNDQLITGMISQLPADTIQTGTALLALKLNSDHSYTLTFQTNGSTFDVVADRVILTPAFMNLREVDLSRSGFSARKMLAINNYQLGTNSKINVQFNSRPWVTDGKDGYAYTDPQDFGLVWEASVAQVIGDSVAASPGILTFYPGGVFHFPGGPGSVLPAWQGPERHLGPAPDVDVQAFLARLEPVFPGSTAAYSGKAYRTWSPKNRWARGAYSCYQLGQYTSFAGVEGAREGGVSFANEGTSKHAQGFMEGSLEEGNRAADEASA